MVNLVIRQTRQHYPGLLPAERGRYDSLRRPLLPAGEKRSLLDLILARAGPAALLSVGHGLREGNLDPIWRAALRSRCPADLFSGWQRFETYAHSANRLAIEPLGDSKAAFKRYCVGRAMAPSLAENLLICGLIIALLEIIGCRALSCHVAADDGKIAPVYVDGAFIAAGAGMAMPAYERWTIEWRGFAPAVADRKSSAIEAPLPVPDADNAKARRSVQAAAQILGADFLKQWKIGELARQLGMSSRSLQRCFAEAELSFSTLLRALRIQESCRRFQDGDGSIAAIGFCVGFSDSAHFSRDFRASMGMTPSQFRDTLITGH